MYLREYVKCENREKLTNTFASMGKREFAIFIDND